MEQHQRSTLTFDRIYDEALTLLHAARDYVQDRGPYDLFASCTDNGLSVATETTRITARLTQIIAWFLTQQAFIKGEISVEDARAEEHKISLTENLTDECGEENISLPRELRDILKDTRSLFERVARLDEMFRKNTSH